MELYEKLKNNVRCLLCPEYCLLSSENRTGKCGIRQLTADGNAIYNPSNGILSAMSLDPIEKKPLYHFYPGKEVYSIGFYGCTLHCSFCQNYGISQISAPENSITHTPDMVVEYLKQNKYSILAFTYSEPLLYAEWVTETAKLCRNAGIKTVLVTNGYATKQTTELILPHIDAANIDLKSFNNDYYRNYTGGTLKPVTDFIQKAYSHHIHIEVTSLIIPGLNDSAPEIEQSSSFIASISKDIPFHLTAYYPAYKMHIPPTDPMSLIALAELARKNLNYVYTGNIAVSSETRCRTCSAVLVQRQQFRTTLCGLDESGLCKFCKAHNAFIM